MNPVKQPAALKADQEQMRERWTRRKRRERVVWCSPAPKPKRKWHSKRVKP